MKTPVSLLSALSCLLLLWAVSCKKADTPVTPVVTPPVSGTTVTATKSSAKAITAFAFNALSPAVTATIDATAKTISATVASGTDVTKLVPTLTISDKATVSPASGAAQDFSKAVTYTVTAEDGTTQAYTATVSAQVVASTSTNFVYVGTSSGVNAYDATTGEQVWVFPTNNQQVKTDPYVLDGVVYFGSYEKKMYAVDAKTGVKKWEFQTVAEVLSSPVVEKGILYFGGGSSDKKVYALDAATGAKKWDFAIGGSADGSPVVSNGVVYTACFVDKTLYAIDAASGNLKWKYGSDISGSSVCVSNGLVYTSDNQNRGFLAIDADKGTVKWRFSFPSNSLTSSPTLLNNIVYCMTFNGILYALDATTGDKKWEFQTSDISYFSHSSPFASNGMVYVVGGSNKDNSTNLYALDAATGAKKWSTPARDESKSPVVVKDVVYIIGAYNNITYNNPVLAIDAATGTIRSQISTSPTTNPTFLIDGKVYMSGNSGSVQ